MTKSTLVRRIAPALAIAIVAALAACSAASVRAADTRGAHVAPLHAASRAAALHADTSTADAAQTALPASMPTPCASLACTIDPDYERVRQDERNGPAPRSATPPATAHACMPAPCVVDPDAASIREYERGDDVIDGPSALATAAAVHAVGARRDAAGGAGVPARGQAGAGALASKAMPVPGVNHPDGRVARGLAIAFTLGCAALLLHLRWRRRRRA